MSDRNTLIEIFLQNNGWGGAERNILAADASFRTYDRLHKDGKSAVLMNAPPPKEKVEPFIKIDKHLRSLGLSAPEILAEDIENGLLLLEDFGDDTYTKLLKNGASEAELYKMAVDVMVYFNLKDKSETIPANHPSYTDEMFTNDALLLVDWYMPSIFGKTIDEGKRQEYIDLWRKILPLARNVEDSLIIRDYHVDNLMKLKGKEGLQTCGILDFQDAVSGPISYDMMSLMEDARRDINPAFVEAMRDYYLSEMKKNGKEVDPQAFKTSWAILGACRHAKVIGIFTRLCVRDNKPKYLCHIQRVWGLLERSLEHEALKDIKNWIDVNIPKDKRITPTCP